MTRKTTSNTGAQTPMGEAEAAPIEEKKQETGEVLGFIDYISCTFPYRTNSDLENLTIFLGGCWENAVNRKSGYTLGLRCGSLALWYGGRRDMGISLEASGRGCRQLEDTIIKHGWPAFIEELLEMRAKFSRLDVAIDDQAGIISFDEIEHCCLNRLVVCRFDTFNPKQQGKISTGKITKNGFTFGSRESNTMLRIYDKALEQGEEGNHVRVELEATRIKAHNLARKLATDGESIIAGVIAATVDFKIAGADSHKSRLKSLESWLRLLGEAEKIRLTTAPSDSYLEKSMIALEYQYGMTMARVVREYGEQRLLEMAHNGEIRLRKKEFKLAV